MSRQVSLWQPLHVERGFQPSDSTVTVHAGSSPYHIGSSGNTAEGYLGHIDLPQYFGVGTSIR